MGGAVTLRPHVNLCNVNRNYFIFTHSLVAGHSVICDITVYHVCSVCSECIKTFVQNNVPYGPGSSVGIATELPGWTVRGSNSVGDEILRSYPDRPWGPPSLLYIGYRVFHGGKKRPGSDGDPPPLLVPWS